MRHRALRLANKYLSYLGFRIIRNEYLGLNLTEKRKYFKYPALPLTNDFLIRFADKCDSFVDIGCNQGKFAEHFEFVNPGKPWALIEPIPDLMNDIKIKFEDRSAPTFFFNTALGEFNGDTKFYVTSNEGQSSSTLKLGEKHLAASPDALEVSQLEVPIRTLDTLLADFNFKKIF